MLLVGEPVLGEEEKAALAQVIDSNWITMGERVRAFEQAFARSYGFADAAAVSSCTAGLHVALAALGLGPGDEVLVPSLSFIATANCVLYVGATPVFVDITGLDCPLMSPSDAEGKLTERTKAIILMHYGGYVDDRAVWRRFCNAHGLHLIEDAAHAAGTVGAGTVGDVAVFSFFGNKNMTTAEGGMVVARKGDILERVRQMRAHGMTSTTHQRLVARVPTYDVALLGWNYRMDEFRAAVGLVQLKSLPRWNERRAELARLYRAMLAQRAPGIVVPFAKWTGHSAHHFFSLLLPADVDRETVMLHLRDAGIQTTVHYSPIHTLSFYRSRDPALSLPLTEAFGRRELTVPLHPNLQDAHVDQVVDALASALP